MSDQSRVPVRHARDTAAEIVAAYVAHHSVPVEDLTGLIGTVYTAVAGLSADVAKLAAARPSEAEIRRSIRPDGITSFLDGRRYQTLKRHLGRFGHTPETYRARFGLPRDYPMTCADFSEKRSGLSRAMSLARARRDADAASGANVIPLRVMPPAAAVGTERFAVH